MTRFFLLFALLVVVAPGCAEDPQARYVDDPKGSESGEVTPDPNELMKEGAMEDYAAEQAKLAK